MKPPTQHKTQKGFLKLEKGLKLEGTLVGSNSIATGELVFTTGMVGYTQTLTDPSYYGQIVVFTYPLIGNYGVPENLNQLDALKGLESSAIQVAGVVLSQSAFEAYHWGSKKTLIEWLEEHSIPALLDVDTRFLTQIIRNQSSSLAAIGPLEKYEDLNPLAPDSGYFNPNAQNILPKVSTPVIKRVGKGSTRIALVDCGVKWNIVRQLVALGCEVDLLPWNTDFKKIDCSGWLISNGPGDPKQTGDLAERIQGLFEQDKPVFGICLGFQLMALAAGARTRKLKYGHRGLNQPVNLVDSHLGFMTSQNHGFEVIEESLPPDWKPWFRHINDNSLEGMRHVSKPFRGVQFHPEAAAGPQDTNWILKEFVAGLGTQK